MQICKNIYAHVMINLKLNESRMWKRSDGMFVFQHNREKEKQTFNYKMEEHIDIGQASGCINKTEVMYPMPKMMLGVDEVRGALGRVKKGKQPGPDKLKGEIYKSLKDNERLVEHSTEAYKAILEDGTVLEKWKRSRMVMIQKQRNQRLRNIDQLHLRMWVTSCLWD